MVTVLAVAISAQYGSRNSLTFAPRAASTATAATDAGRRHLGPVRQPDFPYIRATGGEHGHGGIERGARRRVRLIGKLVLDGDADTDAVEVTVRGLRGERGIHAVRVARVVPGDDLEHRGAVGDAPGQGPDVVQTVA